VRILIHHLQVSPSGLSAITFSGKQSIILIFENVLRSAISNRQVLADLAEDSGSTASIRSCKVFSGKSGGSIDPPVLPRWVTMIPAWLNLLAIEKGNHIFCMFAIPPTR
jgi:cell wall assembly regulator SMI1